MQMPQAADCACTHLQWGPEKLWSKAANEPVWRTKLLNANVCIEAHIDKAQHRGHHYRQAALLWICEAQINLHIKLSQSNDRLRSCPRERMQAKHHPIQAHLR